MKDLRLYPDILTNLHPPILESILCLVPIHEAARTSILSKEWRYIWTRVPKLVFNEDTVQVTDDENGNENELGTVRQSRTRKLVDVMKQIMSQRRGGILDFTLDVDLDENENETSVEVDRIVKDLARNNRLDRLSLDLAHGFRLSLGSFSLHRLMDMSLRNCDINRQSRFNGFESLTRLRLHDVNILTETLLNLLSNCTLLKDFTLLLCQDNILSREYATIIELFACVPVIERFTSWGWLLPCLAVGPVPRVLPTSLVRLKSLDLNTLCSIDEYGLPFVIMLIRSAPNLEKLKLEVIPEGLDDYWKEDLDFVKKKKYSDFWLEFLDDFEIEGFSNLKPELDFVKLILLKSPVLKKARIILSRYVANDEEILTLTTTLLRSACASAEVEIIVERP